MAFILDRGYSGNYDINLYFPRGNLFNSSLVNNVNQFILGQQYFVPFAFSCPLTFFLETLMSFISDKHIHVLPLLIHSPALLLFFN